MRICRHQDTGRTLALSGYPKGAAAPRPALAMVCSRPPLPATLRVWREQRATAYCSRAQLAYGLSATTVLDASAGLSVATGLSVVPALAVVALHSGKSLAQDWSLCRASVQ